MKYVKLFEGFLNEGDRSLSDIAKEIYADWKPVHAYAKPYAEAMATLDSIEDMYGADSASEIVARFLGNAASWRGEKAKAIKKELNAMLKNYYKK